MKLKKAAITLPAPICIVATLSCFMTYLNHGVTSQFMTHWLQAFLFSLLVIVPIAGLLIMKISRYVETRLPNVRPLHQKLLQCGMIALSLESILAAVSTFGTTAANDVSSFIAIWFATLIRALPLGYLIAMLMVFIVKPRIQNAMARLAAAN